MSSIALVGSIPLAQNARMTYASGFQVLNSTDELIHIVFNAVNRELNYVGARERGRMHLGIYVRGVEFIRRTPGRIATRLVEDNPPAEG